MNKSQLVDALADRLGDRRTAATAVDALLQIVVDTVQAGDSVSLAGFGVFESRARAARTGRNPRTGETVAVPATTVPAFRPGTGFRTAVAGEEAAAAPAPARRTVARTASPSNAAAVNGVAVVSPTVTASDGKATQTKVSTKKAEVKKADVKKADAKKADKKPAKGKKGKK